MKGKVVLPKISVITICKNAATTIQHSFDSIKNQNYPGLEYIVIDASSCDGTVSIIKRNKDIISFWVSESDNGPADAYHKGIAKATGDLIHFLNADDCLAPNTLFKISSAFLQHNHDTDIISCGVSIRNLDNNKEILKSTKVKNIQLTLENMLFKHPLFNCHFFRSTLLKNNKPFRSHCSDGTLCFSHDREFLAKLALQHKKNYVIEEPLYIYYSHPDSDTLSRKNIIKIRYEQIEIAENFLHSDIPLTLQQIKVIKRYLYRHMVFLVVLYILKKDFRSARKVFREGLKNRSLQWFLDCLTEPVKELYYRLSVNKLHDSL